MSNYQDHDPKEDETSRHDAPDEGPVEINDPTPEPERDYDYYHEGAVHDYNWYYILIIKRKYSTLKSRVFFAHHAQEQKDYKMKHMLYSQ